MIYDNHYSVFRSCSDPELILEGTEDGSEQLESSHISQLRYQEKNYKHRRDRHDLTAQNFNMCIRKLHNIITYLKKTLLS